jgi:hypothetical protein
MRPPKHVVDDTVLCEDIPLGESLDLAFAKDIHGFIALDGPLRSAEDIKSSTRIARRFTNRQSCFQHIIYVLAWPHDTAFEQSAFPLKRLEGRWISWVTVDSIDGDQARGCRMARCRNFAKEAFCGLSSAGGAKQRTISAVQCRHTPSDPCASAERGVAWVRPAWA